MYLQQHLHTYSSSCLSISGDVWSWIVILHWPFKFRGKVLSLFMWHCNITNYYTIVYYLHCISCVHVLFLLQKCFQLHAKFLIYGIAVEHTCVCKLNHCLLCWLLQMFLHMMLHTLQCSLLLLSPFFMVSSWSDSVQALRPSMLASALQLQRAPSLNWSQEKRLRHIPYFSWTRPHSTVSHFTCLNHTAYLSCTINREIIV